LITQLLTLLEPGHDESEYITLCNEERKYPTLILFSSGHYYRLRPDYLAAPFDSAVIQGEVIAKALIAKALLE